MAIVVVGGHSRNVGKTSVVAGLVSALSRYSWTAIKISFHGHAGLASQDPKEIYEERNREGREDTCRFLAAGASRSLWVRMDEDNAESVAQRLLPIIRSSPYVIIESNRILQFVHPDLYLFVLRYDIEDFKTSASKTIHRADAIVALNSGLMVPAWKGFPLDALDRIPTFATDNPLIIPNSLIHFVKSHLPAPSGPK